MGRSPTLWHTHTHTLTLTHTWTRIVVVVAAATSTKSGGLVELLVSGLCFTHIHPIRFCCCCCFVPLFWWSFSLTYPLFQRLMHASNSPKSLSINLCLYENKFDRLFFIRSVGFPLFLHDNQMMIFVYISHLVMCPSMLAVVCKIQCVDRIVLATLCRNSCIHSHFDHKIEFDDLSCFDWLTASKTGSTNFNSFHSRLEQRKRRRFKYF